MRRDLGAWPLMPCRLYSPIKFEVLGILKVYKRGWPLRSILRPSARASFALHSPPFKLKSVWATLRDLCSRGNFRDLKLSLCLIWARLGQFVWPGSWGAQNWQFIWSVNRATLGIPLKYKDFSSICADSIWLARMADSRLPPSPSL